MHVISSNEEEGQTQEPRKYSLLFNIPDLLITKKVRKLI